MEKTESKNPENKTSQVGKKETQPQTDTQGNDQLTLLDKNDQPVTESSTHVNMMKIDFNAGEMPDLDECEVVPLDLASNYWTPLNLNEKRRAYFVGIKIMDMQSLEDPEILIELPCAFFYWKENGAMKGFCNASKVLVSILKQNHMETGVALEISWLGKKKNSSNSFKSDMWSVKPLMIKISK